MTTHPPFPVLIGAAFVAHLIAKVVCYLVGWHYNDWAQILVAIIAMGAAYRWGGVPVKPQDSQPPH